MTPEQFCYWLQGYFEISNTVNLDQEKVVMIREHLGTVFTKITGSTRPSGSGFSGFCGVPSGSGYSGYCGQEAPTGLSGYSGVSC